MIPSVMVALLLAACSPTMDDDGFDTDGDDHTDVVEPLVVVTFNTGTTAGVVGDDEDYGEAQAAISDEWYGNGLAWNAAIEAVRTWFVSHPADIAVFQEIFHPDSCPDVPEEARAGFVCDTWKPGDPTVVQQVLGDGWQVACHPGKPDKCAAVRTDVGRFEGCDDDLCLEGLSGTKVEDCGSGARVAYGAVVLTSGERVQLVSVHGSSGYSGDDQGCRVAQVEQVFVDAGDGRPAARGEANLIMGDLNTDPGRAADIDASAARWNDFVGGDHAMAFISDVGPDANPTYGGVVNIDHVISDVYTGHCTQPPVAGPPIFDHMPERCEIRR